MKNVVLITVDCLRADHVSCYGYKRKTTPFIDNVAKKGFKFTNAFTNGPNTRLSIPSLLTSTYPLLFLQEVQNGRFHQGRTSISSLLKEHGFSTAGIHSNPYISKFYGYDRGFDYFNDFLIGQVEDEISQTKAKKTIRELVKGVKAVISHKLPHEDGNTINNQAFTWVEDIIEPFFLWIHYMDTHMPYVPPNEYLKLIDVKSYSHVKKIWMGKKIDDVEMRKTISNEEVSDYVNLYDGCIRYVDQIIKNLITDLEKKYSDTLFIITADHGEEFREHGDLGHHEKLYDELLHVPLIFYGQEGPVGNRDELISLVDIVPTMFHFLGLKPKSKMQGTIISNEKKFIITEAWKNGRITAYRDKEWKLILNDTTKELYYLPEDTFEQNNMYQDKNKKELNHFEKIINNHIKMIIMERMKSETQLQKSKIQQAVKKIKKV
jgi:arylsulfatase A-like enzyme